MNLERFTQLVDAYGADAKSWPAEERAAALAFAAASPAHAAMALAEAAKLDVALAQAGSDCEVRPDLVTKIIASAPSSRKTGLGRAGWALAACALLGLGIGFGGGRLAPVQGGGAGDAILAAFEAPMSDAQWEGLDG